MGPTSGYAIVAGKDIRTDLQAIRNDIGICLQHDCLFPDLTVREHLQFFSRLKGLYRLLPQADAEGQIDQAIRDVALFEKRNTPSKNLSGGQKRKLSVAIAFCGGSKVVLLDEPTSGMDPFSRRFTWNGTQKEHLPLCIVWHTVVTILTIFFVCSNSAIPSRSLHYSHDALHGKRFILLIWPGFHKFQLMFTVFWFRLLFHERTKLIFLVIELP